MDKSTQTKLPPALGHSVDQISKWFIQVEEKEHTSQLQSFDHKKKQIEIQTKEYFEILYRQLRQAQALIEEGLRAEKKEALFGHWKEAQLRLRELQENGQLTAEPEKSIQESCHLSWEFCDAAYNIARESIIQNKFQEAADIFQFLVFIQPNVFEYWFGRATALHELGDFEKAVEAYTASLALNPAMPLAFYQIANCLVQDKQFEGALISLQFCIDDCRDTPEQEALLAKAEALQKYVQSKQ